MLAAKFHSAKLHAAKLHAAKFYALSTACLPLLMYQGKQVREHTLRLPPPTGARKGFVQHETSHAQTSHAQKSNSLNLLVLGDSAAEGVGASTQETALLGQLVGLLASTHSVNFQLIANTGDTTADIIAHLKKHMADDDCIKNIDLVVVSAGVNDVTTLTKVTAWQQQVTQLIYLLQHKLGAKHIIFTAVPPMQLFTALPTPLNTWLGLRATMLNQALEKICDQQPHTHFLALALPNDPAYLATDGFHPAAPTYAAWAEAAYALFEEMAAAD